MLSTKKIECYIHDLEPKRLYYAKNSNNERERRERQDNRCN